MLDLRQRELAGQSTGIVPRQGEQLRVIGRFMRAARMSRGLTAGIVAVMRR